MSRTKNAKGDLAAFHAARAKTVAAILGLSADEFDWPTVFEDYGPLA